MNLSRKSSKKTSKISLLIAVVVLGGLFATAYTQGLPVHQMGTETAEVCKAGLVDIFARLLW